jgi:hypothetical protein
MLLDRPLRQHEGAVRLTWEINMKEFRIAALACFTMGATASFADVTGDFKVTGTSYVNDAVTVSGTVNHGAIQSNKKVNVDVTYDYSFVAEKTETIPGESSEIIVFVPGKCVTGIPNRGGCYEKDGVTPKGLDREIWTGTMVTTTTTTEPRTVTHEFNGSAGMTAITEPTIERGRLNPKGKITGYNWNSVESIVPNADLVAADMIPAGYVVVSVTINSISYAAYLRDSAGEKIADTVITGDVWK